MEKIYQKILEQRKEAEGARDSEYRDGYLQGLADCLEILADIAWDAGIDLDLED